MVENVCATLIYLQQALEDVSNDKGFSFERNCVLRQWESETLIKSIIIINHLTDLVGDKLNLLLD